MRAVLAIFGLLVALRAQAETFKWECRKYSSSKTELWLSGDPDTHLGEVKVSRLTRKAFFSSEGLDFIWTFGDEGNFQLNLGADGMARLYDFTGAAKGETRKPTDVFTCKEA